MKSEIVVDLRSAKLGDFQLGSSVVGSKHRQQLLCRERGYRVYLRNDLVVGIFVCFLGGYRGYKKFNGRIVGLASAVSLNSETLPREIVQEFGDADESWDDGTELLYRYARKNQNTEFAWLHNGASLELAYFIIEVD